MTTSNAAATRRDRSTPIRPEEESAALAERLGEWGRCHSPEDGYQEWVLSRAVLASVRLDRNLAHESAVRSYEAERAETCWDDDRRLEAEELGAKIHKDPARVRRRLEDTPQGADWLIERWDALGRIAASGREWSEPQRELALDLLGTPPSLRDGPPPFASTPTTQAAAALAERQRLETLRERMLVLRDEHERAMAVSGVSIRFSPAMVRIHRDESFWTREFHRAFSEFRRARPKPPEPSPTPRHDPAPPPEAARPPEVAPASARLAPSLAEMAAMDRMIMAQLMQARQARGIEDPFEAVDLRPTVSAVSSPVPPQGNRHDRRAEEARLRSQR